MLPLVTLHRRIRDSQVADLVGQDYVIEDPMYRPLLACLKPFLDIPHTASQHGSLTWLTTAKRHVGGLSPDLTITVQNVSNPETYSIIALWK